MELVLFVNKNRPSNDAEEVLGHVSFAVGMSADVAFLLLFHTLSIKPHTQNLGGAAASHLFSMR